jgi:hypothetical protein
VRAADVPRLVWSSGGGFEFAPARFQGSSLALNHSGVTDFDPGIVKVRWHGRTLGELWAPKLFDDGVLRLFDLEQEVYVWPQSSFPHYAVQAQSVVRLGGAEYPAPRDPERWLEWIYGPDWRVPVRARADGGVRRDGVGYSGDRTAPNLHERRAWCLARGWDLSPYAHQWSWPRPVRAAGPRGIGERAERTSRSDWWRSVEELVANY